MKRALPFATLLLLLGGPARVSADTTVSGRVHVVGRPAGTVVPTIIYAEPLDSRPRIVPRHVRLAQKDKAFVPHVVAVPVGSTIDFPNEDPIYHNVFSLSPAAKFDLGLYRAGGSKSRTFKAPATYQVFCNIHPQMAAVILVLPTDFFTEADSSGRYRLELPPGHYRLTAWSERSQPASVELHVGATLASVSDLALDESKFVELSHKNKFGRDYSASAYEQSPP